MKHLGLIVTTALTSVALASTAFAQPAATSAQPDGASEAPRGRLSHINGTPVKVGEHNEYYYDGVPRTNVSSNPIGWMLGFYGVSLSHGVSDHIALRGDVNYYRPIESDLRGFEAGLGAPIYFRRLYQGVFLEPGVIVRSWEDTSFDDDASTTVGPQVLAGWHWLWDSGFNVAVAVGAGRNFSTDEDENNEPFFNGYLRFGYAF